MHVGRYAARALCPMVSLIVTVKLRLLSFHKTAPLSPSVVPAASLVIPAAGPISFPVLPVALLGQSGSGEHGPGGYRWRMVAACVVVLHDGVASGTISTPTRAVGGRCRGGRGGTHADSTNDGTTSRVSLRTLHRHITLDPCFRPRRRDKPAQCCWQHMVASHRAYNYVNSFSPIMSTTGIAIYV